MADETTTTSIPLSEMSLDQLVQISQGLGREADRIREQRQYLARKIAERLAKGERNGGTPGADPAAANVDAAAPGAVIEASAK